MSKNSTMIFKAPCPNNSILYNGSLCCCSPGYLFNPSTKSCSLFSVFPSEWVTSSVIKHSDVDVDYKRMVKYELFYLQIIVISLLIWLLFCGLVRFGKLRDGRNVWFQIRWWISRLDVTFSTKHWLSDETVVKKRKTELGGAFSIASWILFIGLLVALLYQIIARGGTEVYSMRATNAPDLNSFTNDLEFNITTVSSMTCSQLRGLDAIAIGTPGFIDYRVLPLSTFANYSCLNSTNGPIITLRSQNCPLTYDHLFISWQFVDIEHEFPATAVGFQFNFTAKNRVNGQEYANFVSGKIKNGKIVDDKSITYRGVDTNLFKFNLFPRVHLNLNGLKLVQPLLHEFYPGSFARDADELRSLLQSSKDGLINTTLAINFLSTYLVEIDAQKYAGPVSFIADVGGLYCVCIAIFLLLLSLFESRIKRLRREDQVMRTIRKRRIAQDRWHKLRRYVMYTYGCRLTKEDYNLNEKSRCCIRRKGSVKRIIQQEADLQSLSFQKQASPSEMNSFTKGIPSQLSLDKETKAIVVSDLRRELQNIHEYNAMLRQKLMNAQSMLDVLTT